MTLARSREVTVDAEPPVTTILTPTKSVVIDGAAYLTAGAASDATSWVDMVEVSVDGVVPWRRATGLATWGWTWSPLPADGVYTFRARSTDAVGHVSAEATAEVVVDNTPPAASISAPADGKVLTGLVRDGSGGSTVTVSGNATDLVSGAAKAAGVAVVELSIDGGPWRVVWQKGVRPTYPMETAWSTPWRLDAGATGRHRLAVRAMDALGHVGASSQVQVTLDNVPPANLLTANRAALPLGRPFTVPGHADDTGNLPPVPRPVPLAGALDTVHDATVWLDLPTSAFTQPTKATWVGDLNADGRADLAVGLPGEEEGAGLVAVLYGRAGGWPVPPAPLALSNPDASLVARGATGFGQVLAPAGDVNADGIQDLALGDPGSGRVYVVYGQAGTLGQRFDVTSLTRNGQAGRGMVLASPAADLGRVVAAAGDVNADGYGDLLLGGAARSYLVLGRRPVSTVPVNVPTDAAAVIPLAPAGSGPAGVGDVNGDQRADFVVPDPANAAGGGSGVYLILGDATFQRVSSRDPQQTINVRTRAKARFGGAAPAGAQVAALGDVDGDDLADFAYTAADGPRLVLGRRNADWPNPGNGDRTLSGLNPPAGAWLAAPGDVNADGLADLVLGAGTDSAHLILGARPLPATLGSAATLAHVASIASAPFAAGSDCNCDGSSDLLALPSAAAQAPAAALAVPAPPAIPPERLPQVQGPAAGSAALAGAVFARVGPRGPLERLLGGLAAPAAGAAQAPAEVHVAPGYCPGCANDGRTWGVAAFASLQAAVNSGAARVVVHPGLYREALTLRSNVEVIGSGPEVTVLAPPPGLAPAALVRGTGVTAASLARLTLSGESRWGGLAFGGGSTVTLSRLLVRDTPVAVAGDGAGTRLTLVNDTLVANGQGLVATGCATVDVRNTLFALNSGVGMRLATRGCGASLNRYNGWWRNGPDLLLDGAAVDVAGAGQGQVPADPRFVDPTHHDYHLAAGSPALDAGDVSDPPPPGTGERIDLGAFQRGGATYFVSAAYTPSGENDGLEWGVDAFARIQDAVDAATQALPNYGCSLSALDFDDCRVALSIAVAPGSYSGAVTLPSHVHLIGADAGTTRLSGPGSGSVVTLSNATLAAVSGLTISGWGATAADAGIRVAGASNHVTVTRNVLIGTGNDSLSAAVAVADSAHALVDHNTITRAGSAIASQAGSAQALATNNILAGNGYGLAASGGTATNQQLIAGHNLFYQNGRDLAAQPGNIGPLGGDLTGRDPRFVDAAGGNYRLREDSPALNAGTLLAAGALGGQYSDLGFSEVVAPPLALVFGREAPTCATASSGVAQVELGLVHLTDPRAPITATLPTAWVTAALSATGSVGSYWSGALTAAGGEGTYRLYSRGTDAAGNQSVAHQTDWPADGTPPTVSWLAPADGSTANGAGLLLLAEADDVGSGLAAVTFTVDGQSAGGLPVPASRLPVGAAPRFSLALPLGPGSHTLGVTAVDQAGNATSAPARRITLGGGDVATIITPADGSALSDGAVLAQGYARFSGGNKTVTLYVDGQPAGTATLADPAAAASAWTAALTLAGDGPHQLAAVAGSGSLAGAPVVALRLDTGAPTLTAAAPRRTLGGLGVALGGSAGDSGSGLSRVEVSTDGGYRWHGAAVTATGGSAHVWTAGWVPPSGSDSVRYPVRVRALDQAGGIALTEQAVLVDNVAPRAPQGITTTACDSKDCVGIDPGDALRVPGKLDVSWQVPVIDGSGPAAVSIAFDSSPRAEGAAWKPATLSSYSFPFLSLASGWYYLHLAARDPSGNQTTVTFGPYCAPKCDGAEDVTRSGAPAAAPEAGPLAPGGDAAAPQAASVQLAPIVVDGWLDFEDGEWDPATEHMADDPRHDRLQSLYATWDEEDLFFGLTGALWDRDGDLYLYLDTAPGGTHDAAGSSGLPKLAFAADLGLRIGGVGDGQVYAFDGSSWVPRTHPGFAFANGAEGGTEIRLPRDLVGTAGPLRWMAVALGNDRAAFSVFPTPNALAGPWELAYVWPVLEPGRAPNAGQPRSHHLQLHLGAADGSLPLGGPGKAITVPLRIENTLATPVAGATLALSVTAGASIESLAGAPPPGRSEPRHWELGLGEIGAGATWPMTLTLRLDLDLAAVTELILSAALVEPLPSGHRDVEEAELTFDVDGQAPHVVIWQPLPAGDGVLHLTPGRHVLTGTAVDAGAGLERVEYRLDDGPWQPAEGLHAWRVPLDLGPGGRVLAWLRARDAHGFQSAPVGLEILADAEPPGATIQLPPGVITDRQLVLGGTITGTESGAEATAVAWQLDDGPWQRVSGPFAAGSEGRPTWHALLTLPAEEGAVHWLRARVEDEAGNLGPPGEPVVFRVDNVAPASRIESPTAQEPVAGDSLLVWGVATDGVGVAAVEASADGGRSWQPAALGAAALALLGQGTGSERGAQKAYLPLVHKGQSAAAGRETLWAIRLGLGPGPVILRSRATDEAGSVGAASPPLRLLRSGERWPARAWMPWAGR